MKLILLSGGSGKRLWPLSNDSRSKQFLKVLTNEENEYESMVQRVWRQLEHVKLTSSTMIATGIHQVDILHRQLENKAKLIVEPERRDTFAAIALSASYLYSKEGAGLETVVGVLPVDPYVENTFFKKITELEKVLTTTGADLGLIGVNPTYPSSKYGYIIPEKGKSSIIQVSHFKEKPEESLAGKLIENGALWNSGVFAFKLEYILSILIKMGLPIQYEDLLKQYSLIPKNSFDYEVVEKANNIVALPYHGFWKDLGTWNTLTEEMGTNLNGNGQICEESTNTHLINELDIPITVMGIKDAVVAASPDGILVADKQKSPFIKKYVENKNEQVRYHETRWGSSKTLETNQYLHYDVSTIRLTIHAGMNMDYHMHQNRSEVWTIIKGNGEFILEGNVRSIHSGEVLSVPKGSYHSIKAITELEIIVVQSGTHLQERDIEDSLRTWDEIQRLVGV